MKKKNHLIYIQLIIICENDKYEDIKEFIYKKFTSNFGNIDNIL